HTQTVETKQNDQHAADPLDPDLVVLEDPAEGRRARAKKHEHNGEPEHEQRGMQHREPAAVRHFLEGETGDEAQIGGDQRQNAGGEKAQHSPGERHGNAEGRGVTHGVGLTGGSGGNQDASSTGAGGSSSSDRLGTSASSSSSASSGPLPTSSRNHSKR